MEAITYDDVNNIDDGVKIHLNKLIINILKFLLSRELIDC